MSGNNKPSFWISLQGIITTIATLITAVTGLLIVAGSNDSPEPQSVANDSAAPVETTVPSEPNKILSKFHEPQIININPKDEEIDYEEWMSRQPHRKP